MAGRRVAMKVFLWADMTAKKTADCWAKRKAVSLVVRWAVEKDRCWAESWAEKMEYWKAEQTAGQMVDCSVVHWGHLLAGHWVSQKAA